MRSFTLFALVLSGTMVHAVPLKIVAAENFYGGIAAKIAGDDAHISSILSNPNQDPHEFTTSAATARAVADADVVIYNGLSYDPWMDKLLASQGKAGRVVICVADLIQAKEGENPHIWYNPRTMPALAEKLTSLLKERDPARMANYEKGLAEFRTSMDPLRAKIETLKGAYTGVPVTATEPVFGYMAEALGFKMLNLDFQMKVMNDTEPGAQETATFQKSLTSKAARILFYNSQVSDPTTERLRKIAQEAGIPVVGVTETQPPDQKDYVAWMSHELDEVQAALAPKNP